MKLDFTVISYSGKKDNYIMYMQRSCANWYGYSFTCILFEFCVKNINIQEINIQEEALPKPFSPAMLCVDLHSSKSLIYK